MNAGYTPDEQRTLLALARQTLELVTARQPAPAVDLDALPPALRDLRACFVSLHRRDDGTLRGCTGTLAAQRPLAVEVVLTTRQTAFSDPRFMPVRAGEAPGLRIEISVLTPSEPLAFDGPDDLLRRLHPGVDGVTLRLDGRRATFLPQVWQSCPDPELFLSLLSQKMGYDPDAWRNPRLEVDIYHAIVFEEPD